MRPSPHSHSSCPALCRASTSYLCAPKEGVDGRDEPGHDGDGKEKLFPSPSPVRRVERDIFRDLTFPAVTVRKQAFFVVVELLARLGGEFEIRPFDNGVDGTGFLAQSAINALHHIDVVTRCTPRTVIAPRTGLDGDGLCGTNRLAKLACDAALFAIRIAAQRVLTTEARRDRPLLERIIERSLRLEEIAHGQHEAGHKLHQEQAFAPAIESHRILISSRHLPARRTE